MTHPLSSDIEHWHLTCSHFVVLCNTFLILPTHPTPWKLVTQEKPEKYPTIYSVILPVLGVFMNGVEMVSKSPNVLWLKYIYELLRISWFKIWSRFTEDNVESHLDLSVERFLQAWGTGLLQAAKTQNVTVTKRRFGNLTYQISLGNLFWKKFPQKKRFYKIINRFSNRFRAFYDYT